MNSSATHSTVSYQGIRDAVSQINANKDDMNTILNNTKTKMDTIEDVWNSDAERQVKSHFDSMATKFQGFVDAVNSYATFLDNAVTGYEQIDTDIGNSAQKYMSN